jgi:hypothetical protein
MLANVDNEKIATNICDDVLKDFYGVLKSVESSLKFVFITGVSKFAKTSLFSDLNNLVDLTIREEFSTICGYTQKELEDYFGSFPNFDVNNLDLKTILLQSGYLTIKKKTINPGDLTKYDLDIPNKEVRESLFSYIK